MPGLSLRHVLFISAICTSSAVFGRQGAIGWSDAQPPNQDGYYSFAIPHPSRPIVKTPEASIELDLPESDLVTIDVPDREGRSLQAASVTDPGPVLQLSVDVPDGNYQVHIYPTEGAEHLVVRAETRRLMAVVDDPTEPISIIVNKRDRALPPPPPYAPGGDAVRTNEREEGSLTWDDKLTLSISGDCLHIGRIEIEPADVPTVFLAGDSTVTDQAGGDYGSWGQILPLFFKPDIAIANNAESGETLKSFLTGLRLDKILSQAKAGDYLFIQFGHNDEKDNWPQTYVEPKTTYSAYLGAYIAEARRRGIHPVLVTSMHRWKMDDEGHIIDTHGDYPPAMRKVAAQLDVPLVDLHAMSKPLFESIGAAGLNAVFANGGKDHTHQSQYGGYLLARCLINGIRDLQLPLADFIKDDVPPFDPAHPGNEGRYLIVR